MNIRSQKFEEWCVGGAGRPGDLPVLVPGQPARGDHHGAAGGQVYHLARQAAYTGRPGYRHGTVPVGTDPQLVGTSTAPFGGMLGTELSI